LNRKDAKTAEEGGRKGFWRFQFSFLGGSFDGSRRRRWHEKREQNARNTPSRVYFADFASLRFKKSLDDFEAPPGEQGRVGEPQGNG
jgi:hypothetical protein